MEENKPKKVVPVVIEGLEINGQNTTFSRLQEFSLTLFEKLLNFRKQRNFLTLERDNLRTILENTRLELRVAGDISLGKDEELERLQERQREELREVEQEVKYRRYDQEKSLEEVKSWEESMMKKAAENHLTEELELLQEKRRLKEELIKERNKYNEEVETLKVKHLEEIKDLKQECYEVQVEKDLTFKRSVIAAVEQWSLKHEMEMSELEERKNTHLAELKKVHKNRFEETKMFFNSVISENLAVISNLKQSLNNAQKNKEDLVARVKYLTKDNDRLREPLARSEANVKTLKKQVINYEKDLLSLKNNKQMLKDVLRQAKQVEKESASAIEKIGSSGAEDSMDTLDHDVFRIKSVHKKQRLEEVINHLVEELKGKQKLIQELTGSLDVQQRLSEATVEVWRPKQLSYELAVVCKAHDELLASLKQKLQDLCVSGPGLSLNPVTKPFVGLGPAGFVSHQ